MFLRRAISSVILACLAAVGRPAAAAPLNLAPLGIQAPAIVPADSGEFECTFSYASDYYSPFQRWDIDRTVAEMPSLRLSLGLGERAEFQMHINYLLVDNNEMSASHGVGDLTIGTKIRLLRQNRPFPPLSVLFATKLPNADDSSDLGTDQTDFSAVAISSYDYMDYTFYVNLGLDILADPIYNHSGQDDMFRYGAGVRAPVMSNRLHALVSVEGLTGEPINRRGALRFGLQYEANGLWTWHMGLSAGYKDLSEDWSIRFGVIRRFSLPEDW